ncbi:MAG TPA: NADPH-dependent FMN reductase [Pseudolabrys sp.]|nr:NADPH-dependent FMN reductase [Pseudolabrys sp.]
MPKKSIVAVSGSASPNSKSSGIVDHAFRRLADASFSFRNILLRDLAPEALITARTDDPGLAGAIKAVDEADGIIFATPIYKASYSGLLKIFIDVLPQYALAGKVVLPIATGGSLGHLLALDYGLRPVLQSMGARHIVQSLFVTESDMRVDEGGLRLGEQADILLSEAVRHFRHAVENAGDDRLLGHPRPARVAA